MSPEVFVKRWSAWAPDHRDEEAWRDWARAPVAPKGNAHPDVSFLPAMFRRRCNPLARLMLAAAFDGCEADAASEPRTVFASRHGSINDSLPLLEALALRKPLSPTAFSHTVHNVQAGLFSIAAENRQPSSSVSGSADTFESGFIEALTHLDRDPERDVLLVVGDHPLHAVFAPLVDEDAVSYAFALLLSRSGSGTALRFELAPRRAPASPPPWPTALEFLRWLLSSEERLETGTGPSRFVWHRARA